MEFGYFLQKVVGAGRNGFERWEFVDFVAVPLDGDDPHPAAVREAISAMPSWADERLADHDGYYEIFHICLASREDGGCPGLVFAEEFRVMMEGERLDTATVVETRELAAACLA